MMMTDRDVLEWLRCRHSSLGTRCYESDSPTEEITAIRDEMCRILCIVERHVEATAVALAATTEQQQIYETVDALDDAPEQLAIKQEEAVPAPTPQSLEDVKATLRRLQHLKYDNHDDEPTVIVPTDTPTVRIKAYPVVDAPLS